MHTECRCTSPGELAGSVPKAANMSAHHPHTHTHIHTQTHTHTHTHTYIHTHACKQNTGASAQGVRVRPVPKGKGKAKQPKGQGKEAPQPAGAVSQAEGGVKEEEVLPQEQMQQQQQQQKQQQQQQQQKQEEEQQQMQQTRQQPMQKEREGLQSGDNDGGRHHSQQEPREGHGCGKCRYAFNGCLVCRYASSLISECLLPCTFRLFVQTYHQLLSASWHFYNQSLFSSYLQVIWLECESEVIVWKIATRGSGDSFVMFSNVSAQLFTVCAAYTTFQSTTVVASSVTLTFSSSSSACVHVSVHNSPHFVQHTPLFNQQLSWHPLLHLLFQAHPVHVCMCLCTTLHTLRSIHHVSINNCRGILCCTYFLKLILSMCACVCARLSTLCAAYTTFQSTTVVASSVALTFSSSSSACVHVSVHNSPHFAQHTPLFNQQLS